MKYSFRRQTEKIPLVAFDLSHFSFSSSQSTDDSKVRPRTVKVTLWCLPHRLPRHCTSERIWSLQVLYLQPNWWSRANSLHAEPHWLTDQKGTIYSIALVPHSGEITANVLLISISDDITTADLIVSLASLSSLSITPDFKRKNKTKSNEWNEPWD